jgi:Bacteriocin-protection, YdeI or OmpD-Associated/Domain of unknown function (DUF1905)
VTFAAPIQAGRGGGHLVEVPAGVAAAFDSRRPAVQAVVNGVDYRSRLMVYGGRSYLGLRKDLLAQIGADVGDEVEVELTADTAPRVVDEPGELTQALAGDPVARTAYDRLSFTHRREYATWVAQAKKAETRTSRAAKAVEQLRVRSQGKPGS